MDQGQTETCPDAGARPLPVEIPTFTLRPVALGDETLLAAFYEALSPESTHFFEPYRDTSVAAMAEVVRRAVTGEDLSLVAVDAAGRVFGHIFYLHVSREVPHLGIGLLDAYHGYGLGSTLFVYLIGLGRHVLRKKTVGLTVMKENRRALHIYRKYGFEIVRDVTFRTTNDSYELWLTFDRTSRDAGAAGNK